MNQLFKREFRKILFCERRRKVDVLSGVVKTDEIETYSAALLRNPRMRRQDNYQTPAEIINNQGSENHQREEPFEWFRLATLSTYASKPFSENFHDSASLDT